MKKLVKYWGPVVSLMVVIFILSSRESTQVSEVYVWNFIFFKSLHVIEYGLLYFLIFRAVLQKNDKIKKKAWIIAFCLALAYAISDEIHQTFVPTREGKLRDVGIDAIGMALMYAYTKYRLPSVQRFL